MHPLLDRAKQVQAQLYEKEKRWLGLAGAVLSLLILLAFYYCGLSAWLANFPIGNSVIWNFLLYMVSLYAVSILLGLPLAFYTSYIHEHQWNFSNHTVKTWTWEKAKSFLVGLFLMILLLGLLFWIMALTPRYWWLITGLAMSIASVIFATLLPIVILPIFNKYTPIQNKELIDALGKILSEAGLKSGGFFMEDMSRQTKKENAFLAGLGKTRRVILADNLMKNMSVPEIESIIAHEVGHYKHKHIWKNIALGTLQQLIVFYVLNRAMTWIFPQFLTSTKWNLTLFPFFIILMAVISTFLFGPLGQALSRYFEREADRISLEMIEDKKAFLTAISGLADRNLLNAYPKWWVKLLYYSHPPIGDRLAMAENFVKKI